LSFFQQKLAGFNNCVILIPFFIVRTALDGLWFFPEKENTAKISFTRVYRLERRALINLSSISTRVRYMSAFIFRCFQRKRQLPMNKSTFFVTITFNSTGVIFTFFNHSFLIVMSLFMSAHIWFRNSSVSQGLLPENIPAVSIIITGIFAKPLAFDNFILISIMSFIMSASILRLFFLVQQWLFPV
jgi:hypothetical protein